MPKTWRASHAAGREARGGELVSELLLGLRVTVGGALRSEEEVVRREAEKPAKVLACVRLENRKFVT